MMNVEKVPSSESEYVRLIRDVCNIFRDVVGVDLSPTREAGAIIPFAKEFQWGNYEFRLIIEWSMNDPSNREYLMKPGCTNLRTIFNPQRRERLLDVVESLKHIEKVQAKIEERKQSNPAGSPTREQRIKCHCGQIVTRRFLKVFDGDTRFHWQWVNQEEYEAHHTTHAESGASKFNSEVA